MLYLLLKRAVGVFFNLLNILLGGNLPPFACVCILVEQEGRFLAIERTEGGLAFPGGFMRWHEQPEEAARRECEEETGLEIEVSDVIGYETGSSTGITRMSTMTFLFAGRVLGGSLRESIEGQPRWLEPEEVAQMGGYYQALFARYQQYRRAEHARV
ncbi:NUDIX domain-containing protein [Thermosporothrix hazakensis]|uniref:NUDIX domain-containing protein n=2 Tax=Thermosporothrix TaxID=768650 RepID=A0A326UBQ0_THEHA|nr:NUDIX domain-containing protein [Thermosporothrix hazakensis]PZW36042.1 NUDIX domain-containing protein [Thermosporothrix hazakensis]BBH88510.1 hypothetical protein KTC_32610 [Thermosporothrix sp. COM3]GCE46695.1 hypothetical protein KTH_15640 [Thermosporothrix hazakensis]